MTIQKLFLYIGLVALLLTVLRYFLQDYKKVLQGFIQNFVGTLFIFSGFVKAVDPMGTSIKMHEYFEAMHIEFFNPVSTPLTVAMLVAELTLGVALLVGFKPKVTTSLLLFLNVFFLLLTGYTYLSGYEPNNSFFIVSILAFVLICIGAVVESGTPRLWTLGAGFAIVIVSLGLMRYTTSLLTHPFDITKMKVTDCGCFGDFIKLKPWQTFYKDVILTCMAFILAIRYRGIKPSISWPGRDAVTYVALGLSFVFCLYNLLWSEPVIDFRPYAIGSDLNVNRTVQKPEKRDFVFVYKNKKTGQVKDISMKEMSDPNSDFSKHADDWEYKDRKDIILDEGIPARITNLFIYNADKEDITDSLFHDPNYELMVVAPHLDDTHESVFRDKLNPLAEACDKAHIKIFVLTADDAEAFRHKNQTAYPFYMADETPIKTMMRSNPGLMLLKNGVVINKWHYKNLPTFDELNAQYFSKK
jgi:uncharacterized membrane protein YphA (DoxX/SURF4 family)